MIFETDRKSDRVDAQYLARLGRLDPELLAPIKHRGEDVQVELALLRSRDALVRARTALVNHVRGVVKLSGSRLPTCSTHSFASKVGEFIPEELRPALEPVLETLAEMTRRIRAYDKRIEELAAESYPEMAPLQQVSGVGALTALCFILTLETPERFKNGRAVGAYLGLCPRQSNSGDSEPQLRITRTGSSMLRSLLVGSAHYILGPFGPDTDLRRWGLKLAARGGKNAKKRAVIAVARKLSTLLHSLWSTGEAYVPLRNSGTQGEHTTTAQVAWADDARKQTKEAVRADLRDPWPNRPVGGDCDIAHDSARTEVGVADSSASTGRTPACTWLTQRASTECEWKRGEWAVVAQRANGHHVALDGEAFSWKRYGEEEQRRRSGCSGARMPTNHCYRTLAPGKAA